MIRLRELVLRWQREWVPLDEVSHLPATTRVLVFGLMGWSGLALAVTLGGVLDIEIAARGLAPVAAKQARAAKLEQSGGEAILQRPVFSRTRQAARPVIARPQPPPLPPPPAPLHALVARDSDMRLRGVFMNAPVVKAFLLSAQNPTGAWVKPDEVFGGWKLVAVRPSDVELEGGGEHLTVALGEGSPGNTGGAGHDKNVVQNFRPNPPFRR
jgi:hypothetical protein